jgi:hypothetical protein
VRESTHPDLADHGQALIEQWTAEMMSASDFDADPLWTVMREGGPFHVREIGQRYLAHLRATGRGHHADFLEKHPTGWRQ